MVDKSLDPPGQRVIFEETWSDDGSCLEWISLKENLVPAVASRKLDKYIADLKAALQSGRPLELPGIGSLEADPLGRINFRPESLPGKPDPLHLQPVLRPDATPKVTVGTTEVVNKEVVEHLTPIPPWELEEQQSRFKWWWVAIPIAAALVATAIWWFVSNQVPTEPAAENSAVTTPTPMDTMTLPPEVTQTDTSTAVVTQPANDTLQYYIVFATYSTLARAEGRRRQLERNGLPVEMYANNDSTKFFVRMKYRSLAEDTAKNIKHVKAFYGPNQHVYLEF